MADTKTTAEDAASALGGTELVRGVQSAANVKITIDQIKTWCSTSPTFTTPILGVADATSLALANIGGIGLKTQGGGFIIFTAAGVLTLLDNTATSFGLLQFGGATSSFPSLKRNGTALEVKLADDSAFASIKGKLTTDTAATTGLTAGALAALTNASIVVYDSGGQAYRVPCII